MAFILGLLLILAEVVGMLLALLMGLVVLLTALPLHVEVSGSLRALGALEESLDNGARLVFRVSGDGAAGRGVSAPEEGVVPTPEEGVVPIDVRYRLSGGTGLLSIAMASGSRPEVGVAGLRFRPRSPKGAKKGRSVAAKAARTRGFALADLKIWLAPAVREKTLSALKSLLRALHFTADVDLECGFPDPGYTGMAFAAYSALGWTGVFHGIRFHPRFDREVVDARGSFGLRVIPVQVAWVAGRFLLAREIKPLWWKRKTGRGAGGSPARVSEHGLGGE